jgi:hypothetical protein
VARRLDGSVWREGRHWGKALDAAGAVAALRAFADNGGRCVCGKGCGLGSSSRTWVSLHATCVCVGRGVGAGEHAMSHVEGTAPMPRAAHPTGVGAGPPLSPQAP